MQPPFPARTKRWRRERQNWLPVGGRGEVEGLRLSPGAHDNIVLLALTEGHGGVGDVGDLQQQPVELLLDLPLLGLRKERSKPLPRCRQLICEIGFDRPRGG